MTVEQVRSLEALHRVARDRGAVICLTTDRDSRLPGGGRRVHSNDTGAQLRMLAVVRPLTSQLELTRWQRLQRGTVLACCPSVGEESLDLVAELLLDELGGALGTA